MRTLLLALLAAAAAPADAQVRAWSDVGVGYDRLAEARLFSVNDVPEAVNPLVAVRAGLDLTPGGPLAGTLVLEASYAAALGPERAHGAALWLRWRPFSLRF